MTKENRRIKGSCLKSVEKKMEVKEGNFFKGEGAVSSYGAQKSRKRKARFFFERKKQFPYEPGKAERCHNSK